jgi:PKHD-type hydroxylase
MNFKSLYWYFTSVLTPRFCDDVIKYGLQQQEQPALTGRMGTHRDIKKDPLTKEEKLQLKHKRSSDVVWLAEPWLYKEIHPYIHIANKNAGWNFQWDFTEPCQFTKYKLDQYYDWHCDSWAEPYKNDKIKNKNLDGKIRKLSVTCQLSDGSEYKGGELQFDFRNYEPHLRDEIEHCHVVKEILPRGSIIVFPSEVWHRVKPVTKGVRYSLVMWNLGQPFK